MIIILIILIIVFFITIKSRENFVGNLNTYEMIKNKFNDIFNNITNNVITIDKNFDIKDLFIKGFDNKLNINGDLKVDNFCIGNTCIDSNHLKFLRGEKTFTLMSTDKTKSLGIRQQVRSQENREHLPTINQILNNNEDELKIVNIR